MDADSYSRYPQKKKTLTNNVYVTLLLLYVKMGSLQVLMFVAWLLLVSQLVICQDFKSSEYSALKVFYDATEGEYWTYNGASLLSKAQRWPGA